MLKILIAILLFVAGVLLTTAFQIFLQEPLHHFLARILSGWMPRKTRNARGIWECCYRYQAGGVLRYEQQLMRLYQVGTFVVVRNVKYQSHKHRLTGRLDSSLYLTGRWENMSEGEIWHGTYQFVLHTDGRKMRGKWLGFNSNAVVQQGPWVWRLLTRDTSKDSINSLRKEWEPDPSLRLMCCSSEATLGELMSIYGKAWEQQDSELLDQVFTSNAIYQERVFGKAMSGISEIKQYWQRKVIDQQKNIRFELLTVLGGEDMGVAEWMTEFDDLAHGVRKQIREAAFLELADGKICSLREYWVSRRVP